MEVLHGTDQPARSRTAAGCFHRHAPEVEKARGGQGAAPVLQGVADADRLPAKGRGGLAGGTPWIALGKGGRWNRVTKRYLFKHYLKGGGGRVAKIGKGTAKTLIDATTLYQKFLARFECGDDVPTFAGFVEKGWTDALDIAEVKDGTRAFYDFALRTIIPIIGKMKLTAITAATVEKVSLDVQRKGKSKTTARSYAQVVMRVLRAAVDREFISEMPVRRKVKLPKANKPQGELSLEEEGKLLEVLTDRPELRDLVIVALETGLRKSDLLALRFKDVGTATITVTQIKTGEPVTVPVTDACQVAIESRKKGVRAADGRVFLHGGQAWTKTTLQDAWNAAKKAAGITRPLRFHDLRHTFGSKLATLGVPLQMIGTTMGHKDAKSTQRYARPRVDVAVETVRNALNGTSGPGGAR